MTNTASSLHQLDRALRQQILSLSASPISCAGLAQVLGLSRPVTAAVLEQLADVGELEVLVSTAARTLYVRPELNPALVKAEYTQPILQALHDGPALPSFIAQRTKLPLDEVQETCKALRRQGVLSGVRVGCSVVYRSQASLNVWVDPERAQQGRETTAKFTVIAEPAGHDELTSTRASFAGPEPSASSVIEPVRVAARRCSCRYRPRTVQGPLRAHLKSKETVKTALDLTQPPYCTPAFYRLLNAAHPQYSRYPRQLYRLAGTRKATLLEAAWQSGLLSGPKDGPYTLSPEGQRTLSVLSERRVHPDPPHPEDRTSPLPSL